MDDSLAVKLLLGLGVGIAAELLFELALPSLAGRLRQVWWIAALSRTRASRLLVPVWLAALGAVGWGVHTGFASGSAALLFVALPALAAGMTVWRLGQPARWRRSSDISE